MRITVVGYRRIEFTVRGTGRNVSGYRLYYLKDEYNVTGKASEYCFISDRYGYTPCVGDNIILVFNKDGKLVSIDFSAG